MHPGAFPSSRIFKNLKKSFQSSACRIRQSARTMKHTTEQGPITMSDPADNSKNADDFNADAFKSLNFGPAWASGKPDQPKPSVRPEREDTRGGPRRDDDRRDRRGFERKRFDGPAGGAPSYGDRPAGDRPTGDRPAGDRPFRPRPEGGFRPEGRRDFGARPPRPPGDDRGPRRDFGDRGPRPQGDDRGPRRDFGDRGPRREFSGERRDHFRPVVDTDIYPEEKPFGGLLKAIKASCRTYELFEIAKTILEKNERFVVSVKPLDSEKNPESKLYQSVPDHLPFLSEHDAIAHVLKTHPGVFFTEESVEIEAPKGAFTSIARCGFTGAFLAPPNYHGYTKALQDHYAATFSERDMSFDRFRSRVETVKDEAAVAAWLESKKKLTRYTLVDRAETEPEHFDSLDAVRHHLVTFRKDKIVKALPFVRFSGKDVEKLPQGALRATVEHEIAFQRKFPLDTANAIRGRLRKAGFSLYKRGAKGITFLCGVKRKFRTPATPPFSDDIQRVFDFIERTQDIASGKLVHLSDLPEQLLGIKPAAPAAEAPKPAPTPSEQNLEIAKDNMEAEGDPQHAPTEETKPEAPAHSPEETARLHGLAQNLRWLVTEGYVTEFSDGRLLALPVMTEAQAKAAAAEDEGPGKPEAKPEAPAVETPEA